jgi:hypothetical protein
MDFPSSFQLSNIIIILFLHRLNWAIHPSKFWVKLKSLFLRLVGWFGWKDLGWSSFGGAEEAISSSHFRHPLYINPANCTLKIPPNPH